MLELRLALRFLRMAGRQAHTAFLSLISLLGITVGVATVIVSIALLSGMQAEVKDRLRDETPHLVVESKGRSSIERHEDLVAALDDGSSPEISVIVEGIGWASTPEGQSGRPATITSRAPDQREGRVGVTIDLASALGLTEGDEIVIVSPRTTLTPFGEVPVWKRLRIDEILLSHSAGSSAVLLDYELASRFFATSGEPTRVEVRSTPERAEATAAAVASRFPELSLRDWAELNRPLFLALELERIVMFATISLVVLVAALNLVSSLAMTIVEKRKQVGILTTLGASRRTIGLSFLLLGLAIAIGGAVLGTLTGVGFSFIADRWELIRMPGMGQPASLLIDARDVAEVNVLALVLAAMTTLYPVWAATKLTPQEALRED